MTACIQTLIILRSIFKDYAVFYFGSALFKIIRLLFIAIFSIHFFACAFYRVKNESAVNPDDVETFYLSRNVDPAVQLEFEWHGMTYSRARRDEITDRVLCTGSLQCVCESRLRK